MSRNFIKSFLRISLFFIVAITIIFISQSCNNSKKADDKSKVHAVVVKEAIQAGDFTYMRVTEGTEEKWLAVPACIPMEGATYYYKGGIEMKNFECKELNRTFETVYSIDNFSSVPLAEGAPVVNTASQHVGNTKTEKVNIKIAPVPGGTTIAELYKNKTSYAGKTVKVKGMVTKFSPAIMNKNWVHIQDGTEFDNNFDLTFTFMDVVKMGDTVTAEGKISLDKDYGYNYTYKIIMEDAVVKKK